MSIIVHSKTTCGFIVDHRRFVAAWHLEVSATLTLNEAIVEVGANDARSAQSVIIKHAVVKCIVINGDTPVHRNRLFLWMERQQRTPHAKPVPVASGDRRAIPGKPANPEPILTTAGPEYTVTM